MEPSSLQRLSNIADSIKLNGGFLHELNLTDTEAFVKYNFVPPSLRRAIGMFGFLHKRNLCYCHPLLVEALPFASGLDANYNSKALLSLSELVSFKAACMSARYMDTYSCTIACPTWRCQKNCFCLLPFLLFATFGGGHAIRIALRFAVATEFPV